MYSVVFAVVSGAAFGTWGGAYALALGELAQAVVHLIKWVSIPILFFSVWRSIWTTHLHWRDGMHAARVLALHALGALAVAFGVYALIRPGSSFSQTALEAARASGLPPTAVKLPELSFSTVLSQWIPKNWVDPWIQQSVLLLVVMSVMLAVASKQAFAQTDELKPYRLGVEKSLTAILETLSRMLAWFLKLVPLAVFGALSSTIAKQGWAPFEQVLAYTGTVMLGLTLQPLLIYQSSILLSGTVRLRDFWREARTPITQAFGVNSSLATLPLTLRALDRLGISEKASRLGSCILTNFNNDGIFLYELVAVWFVAEIHGVSLDWAMQLKLAGLCWISAMGVAGVPEAGFVSLTLVLSAAQLPMESLPLLLAVDWILARMRSSVNVIADLSVSCGIEDSKTRIPR